MSLRGRQARSNLSPLRLLRRFTPRNDSSHQACYENNSELVLRSPILSVLGRNVAKTYREDRTSLEQTCPRLQYLHQSDFKKGLGQDSVLEACPSWSAGPSAKETYLNVGKLFWMRKPSTRVQSIERPLRPCFHVKRPNRVSYKKVTMISSR